MHNWSVHSPLSVSIIHSFIFFHYYILLFTGLFASSQIFTIGYIHFILEVNRDYCIVFQHKEYAGASWSFTEWAVGALDVELYALLFLLCSLPLLLFFIFLNDVTEISANSDPDFSSVQSNTFLSCAV